MKRILKSIFCYLLICIAFTITSCSNNNDSTPSEDDTTTTKINEEYYSMLGYHTITFDKYIKITSESEELVVISESKCMVPNNTNIIIEFNVENNTNFEFNNGNFVNFSEGTILSSFNVNDELREISSNSIKVKNNLNISANLLNFETIGVAYYEIDPYKESSISCSGKYSSIENAISTLQYFYANGSSASDFEESKLVSNATLDIIPATLQNNKFSINVEFEVFLESTDINMFLILKDECNNIYLYEFYSGKISYTDSIICEGLSNKNSNLESVTINLATDITINDKYER